MSNAEVFVFVHDESGTCVGAGQLLYTRKRCDLAGTIPGLITDAVWEGDPDDILAVVRGASLSYHVVPVTQISDFPQHPGYNKT